MKSATEMLGARIRELRKAKGLTQEILAETLGIDQKHMSKIELGKSYPSLDRLAMIAEKLKVPLPSLFEFNHMNDTDKLGKQLEKMFKQLDERDQRRIYKIMKAFLEG